MSTQTLQIEQSLRSTASFRDPSGYVFSRGGRIFRAIDRESAGILRSLLADGFLKREFAHGTIVQTEFVADSSLSLENPGFTDFLEHSRIDPISWPAEWSFSMLADAALFTLELQRELLARGYSLKDATPFNIQFVQGRPVFIDLTSIEKPARMDLWFALGQFQRTFLFPLLLAQDCGWDFRSYFTTRLDGRSPAEVAASIGFFRKWLPRYWLDLTLPLALEKKGEGGKKTEPASQRTGSSQAQLFTLNRLHSKITGLKKSQKRSSLWSEYKTICTYDEAAEKSKKGFIRDFLIENHPGLVLDMGCNTGDYSLLAVEAGAHVVSIDADHDAIDSLYLRIAESKPAPLILPLIIDISNPTPATGFLNRERAAFLERIEPDCVLALALVHHLHVSANLSLAQIVQLFRQITRSTLVLEFVPREDPMFQRLIRFRVDLYKDYSLEACKSAFTESFELMREEPIKNSPRTLLFFRRR